ncbi:unnamed protein product [Brugia timori]|uniref:Transcriptional regulator n=1 Tax=Brugia timori TaxID=42155 RepID=A0A0R3QFL6_9BILA|nr:unnamed protein product [Brugia timori]
MRRGKKEQEKDKKCNTDRAILDDLLDQYLDCRNA